MVRQIDYPEFTNGAARRAAPTKVMYGYMKNVRKYSFRELFPAGRL